MPVTITIEDDVLEALQKLTVPLVDDASSVLRRVLQLPEPEDTTDGKPLDTVPATAVPAASPSSSTRWWDPARRRRPKRGETIPQAEYELPIVKVLQDDVSGVGVPTTDVFTSVREILKHRFQPLDLEELRPGLARWQTRIHFARSTLVKAGLVDSNHPRGVWKLTEQGMAVDVSAVTASNDQTSTTCEPESAAATADANAAQPRQSSKPVHTASPGRAPQMEERSCETGEALLVGDGSDLDC